MQNLNEEDFKKKYLKYKAKYLELKDLLEGGIPPKKSSKPSKTFCKGLDVNTKTACEAKGCSWEMGNGNMTCR